MAKELKLRRGNAAEHANFTGAVGEITYNTTNKSAHLHDGISVGGFEVARSDLSNISNADFSAKASAAGVAGGGGGGGGGTTISGADANASYLIVGADTWGLSNERRIQTTNGIEGTDGGSGGGYTISGKLANAISGPPSNLGAANIGTSTFLARADHVHAMPTANDVQAVPNNRVLVAGLGLALSNNGLLSANSTISLAAQLSDLTNIQISNATNNDLLVYNGATSKWQNFSGNTLGRMTIRDEGAVVGSANAITAINFIGNGVTATVDGSDSSKINVTVPTIFDQEMVEDIVGAMVSGNTEQGINVTYNDTLGKLNFDVNDFSITLTGDVQGTATITDLGSVSLNTVIGANSIALGADTTGNYVGTITPSPSSNGITITGGTGEGVDNVISLNLIDADFIEGVQDIIGNMVSSNTEQGINVTYNDAAGKLNFDVNDFTVTLAGDVIGNATITDLGNITITTRLASNSVTLGSDTKGNYISTIQTPAGANGIVVTNGSGSAANATLAINLVDADFVEGIQDIVGTMVSDNTEKGINVSYNDVSGKLNFDVNDFNITLTGVAQGAGTVTDLGNVTINTTVGPNSIALGADTTGNYVGTVASSPTANGIVVTGAAGEGTAATFALNLVDADFVEGVQDIIGTMVTSNTEKGIDVTYNDATGKLNFDVNDFTITLTGSTVGSATVTDLANVSIATTVAPNSITLGPDTVGNFVATVASSATANGIIVTGAPGEGTAATLALNLVDADFVEGVQDIIGTMVTSNTEKGIDVTYNDATGKLNFDVNDFTLTFTGPVQGSGTITDLASASIALTVAPNSITLGPDTVGNYVGSIAASPAANGIVVSGAVGEGTAASLSLNLVDADFVEGIQDIIGTMVTGNTELGIDVTYNDAAGKLNFDVNDFTFSLSGPVQGSATVTNLGNTTLATSLAAGAVTLGTHTSGAFVASLASASTSNGITLTAGAVSGNNGAQLTVGLNLADANFVEALQDTVATMYDGTHFGITSVYNDPAGKITLSVQNGVVDAASLGGVFPSSYAKLNTAQTVNQQWTFASNVAMSSASLDNRILLGSTGNLTISAGSTDILSLRSNGRVIAANDIFFQVTDAPFLNTINFQTNAIVREVIEDYVANLFTAGTHSNISVTYNDAAGTLSVAVLTAGLNADKLDNYDSTDFTRKAENASVSGNWNFVSSAGDTTPRLKTTDGTNKGISLLPNTGGFNGLVSSGDSVVLATADAIGNGNLTLTTHANATSGIRIGANSVQIEATSVTSGGNPILTTRTGVGRSATHNGSLNPSAITVSSIVSGDTSTINGALNGYQVLSMVRGDNVNYQAQLAISDTAPSDIRYRVRQNGTFTDWYPIWTSLNDGSGSGLDADLLDGRNSTDFALLTGSSFSGTITSTTNVGLRINAANPSYVLTPSDWGSSALVVAGVNSIGTANGNYLLYAAPAGKRHGFHITDTGTIAEISSTGLNVTIGALTRAGNTVWDSANDGAGSGLDADLLDGLNSTSFVRTDAVTVVNSGQNGAAVRYDSPTGVAVVAATNYSPSLLVYQPSTSAGDAFMTFSNNGATGLHLGLDRDTSDIFVGGWNMGGTKNRIYHKKNATYLATPLRANFQMTGGGTVTADGSANVSWTQRFICIGLGNGQQFGPAGYFDILMPASGTACTALGGASSRSWSASGLSLAAWESLYYVLPIGAGSASVEANFRVVGYQSALEIPENWVLIAGYNQQDNAILFPALKMSLRLGESINLSNRAHGWSWTPDANNTRSIGSSSLRYNTVFATTFNGTATSAQYADLAERYEADAAYEPGTVVVFGGDAEITASGQIADRRVAGVISTNPAYMMNSDAGDDATHPYVALVGRVPCRVVGKISKGDMLTTSSVPGHAQATHNPHLGTIIGKALQDHPEGEKGVIEIAVQRC